MWSEKYILFILLWCFVQYWKTKVPHIETYPYPGVMFSHHLPQWDWSEAYNPYSLAEDYHSQASGANNVVHPYPYLTYHNGSFAVKAGMYAVVLYNITKKSFSSPNFKIHLIFQRQREDRFVFQIYLKLYLSCSMFIVTFEKYRRKCPSLVF